MSDNNLWKPILATSIAILLPFYSISQENELNQNDQRRFEHIQKFINKQEINSDSLFSNEDFELYYNIEEAFRNSPESVDPSLDKYKEILGFEDKKEKIVPFTKKYEEELRNAESKYGIDKEIIAATLGIESEFGEITGKYNPLEAYVSMYVDGYRKEFAKNQIRELLDFTERKNLNVLELESSYAGAMGYGQFIPSSVNAYFVGDDLYDIQDNINSIGNYYAKNQEDNLYSTVLRYNPDSKYANAVIDLAEYAERNE